MYRSVSSDLAWTSCFFGFRSFVVGLEVVVGGVDDVGTGSCVLGAGIVALILIGVDWVMVLLGVVASVEKETDFFRFKDGVESWSPSIIASTFLFILVGTSLVGTEGSIDGEIGLPFSFSPSRFHAGTNGEVVAAILRTRSQRMDLC